MRMPARLLDHLDAFDIRQQQIHKDRVWAGSAKFLQGKLPVGGQFHVKPRSAELLQYHEPGQGLVLDQQQALSAHNGRG